MGFALGNLFPLQIQQSVNYRMNMFILYDFYQFELLLKVQNIEQIMNLTIKLVKASLKKYQHWNRPKLLLITGLNNNNSIINTNYQFYFKVYRF